MKTKTLGVDYISFEDFKAIQAGNNQIILTAESRNQLLKSKENVQKIVASGQTVYGINTGFGPLCDTKISEEQTRQLQHNLLISHAVGVGNPIKKELAKTMLVAKAHALAKGYSGVTLEVVERILLMVEKNIIPVVPEKGSVGASGDLAPLSHLFLPLIGEGKVWEGDQIISTKDALAKHNLQPLHLSAKEGLGLINGTQFILSHALHGLKKFEYLLNLADIVGALSLEAYEGSPSPLRAELHEIRPFKGTVLVAERMRKLLEDSGIAHSHIDCGRVQDPYSLRCIPQVHGASRNAFFHLQELAEIELNSVTDNPIVVSDEEAISGGNFHGQPLAMALDYATVAASELGNISDRRQYLLIEGKYGLPKLLTESSGLNSGFMIPQYTSAALCTENKTLCFPASADSIPTSLGQEDHVSMGSISGRKFNQVLDNVERILAIEIMYACQGLEFRRPKQTSPYLEQVFAAVREVCPKLEDDRLIGDDINNIIDLLQTESFQELIMKF